MPCTVLLEAWSSKMKLFASITDEFGNTYLQNKSEDQKSRSVMLNKLFYWMKWRTSVNEDLADDILGKTFSIVPALSEKDQIHILGTPSIYRYGVVEDQATFLSEGEFVNFGLPRAQASFPTKTLPSPDYPANSKPEVDVLY